MDRPETALHDVAWMARRLGRSADWVRRAANRGDLPHHRDGRYLRFTEQDVEAYLTSIAVPAMSLGRSKPRQRRTA
jgi:excisionase family DNA binding protein